MFLADSSNSVVFSTVNVNPPAGVLSLNRAISGSGVSVSMPDIAYDTANDRLYVARNATASSITSIALIEHASTANGNVTPSRTNSGPFSNLTSIYLDTVNDRMYVADLGAGILVFNNISSASGSPVPDRAILVNRVGQIIKPDDVFVDTTHDILYAKIHVGWGGGVGDAIAVFDSESTVTGTIPSDRELKFASSVFGIIGDGISDRLFAVDLNASTIMVFDGASTKDGFVPATRTITTPTFLQRIALVPSTNRLYGVAAGSNAIYIINNASTANGAAPITQVTNSSLGSVSGLAIAQ